MARLASEAKMGYYPTPKHSLYWIFDWIEQNNETHYLDPCCGEGEALNYLANYRNKAWGIELDIERAGAASEIASLNVIQGSIFEAKISKESMGLLFLNPPYSSNNGERTEMVFLKHSIKWLAPNGVLVFIVPEYVVDHHRAWIGEHFHHITVMRLTKTDYPQFKQVVLFGQKRAKRTENGEVIPLPPYPHIENCVPRKYIVPITEGPEVFQSREEVSDEEIRSYTDVVKEKVNSLRVKKDEFSAIKSPILPLKNGHLIALIASGALNGSIDNGKTIIKGFSDRTQFEYEEDDKKVVRDTYAIGIRVIDAQRGVWYDVK